MNAWKLTAPRSTLVSWLTPVSFVLAATVAQLMLAPLVEHRPFLLLYPALMFGSFYSNRASYLFTVTLSTVLAWRFFLIGASVAQAAFALSLFFASGIILSFLVDRLLRRVQAEISAGKSAKIEKELSTVIEKMNDAFFRFDSNFKFTTVNTAFLKMTGKTRAELIGNSGLDMFLPLPEFADHPHRRAYERAMQDRIAISFDGDYDPLNLTTLIRITPEDDGGLAILVTDVSATAKARRDLEEKEKETAKSESLLQLALSGSKIGSWNFDLNTRALQASDATFVILGQMAQHDDLLDRVRSRLHIKDRRRVTAAWIKATTQTGLLNEEFRIWRGDDTYKWIFVQGSLSDPSVGSVGLFSGTIADITERKTVDIAVSEERSKLVAVFETSPIGMAIVTGPSLVFETVNDEFTELVSPREYIGRAWTEVYPELDESQLPFIMREVLASGHSYSAVDTPLSVVSKRGEIDQRFYTFTYTKLSLASKGGALLIQCQDTTQSVTDRQRLLDGGRALEAARSNLDLALKGANIHNWYFDLESERLDASVTALELFAGPSNDDIFESALTRLHPDDMTATQNDWNESVAKGSPYYSEYRIAVRGGDYVWAFSDGTIKYGQNGQPIAVSGIVGNIDERIKARLALEDAKREADRANHLKSAFLANMSHEIRTPLGAMIGFADLLRDPSVTLSERANYLGIMARNGAQLSLLIDDILDLSKVEAGRLTLEYVKTFHRRICADVISLMQVKAKEKDLALEYVFDETAPEAIVADPTRVRQILLNLVGNAIKFTQFGAVRIKALGATHGDKTFLCFEVTDTGIGIKPDQQSRLFQTFVQADETTTRRFGGTGLGLALSRRLARELGGDIIIQKSAVNDGTTFLVSILDQPAKETPNVNEATRLPETKREFKELALKGVRVLVVDDAPDNQQLIWRYLTRQGATVQTAENGQEGYRAALGSEFDIVLMDIQMPVMDGYTATSKLREAGFSKPILALTAHAMTDIRKKALNVGYTDYLTKPINHADLIATILKHTEPGDL